MEKILTSSALWQDFDPCAEPLDSNILKTVEDENGIVTKIVYFTGRAVSDGKTRVLAKVCLKPTKNPKAAVLVIDNYKKPIDEDDLKYWANNGFVAMAIDFAGRNADSLCTLYPSGLDYCNADVAKGYFEVGENAKQSKIYEYALNSMRAITFLTQVEGINDIYVVTVKKGVSVGAIVLGTDKRVKSGAVVFGRLYREYPEMQDADDQDVSLLADDQLSERLAYEEKSQMWTAGLAPQGYAISIQVPLYVICSANSPFVDVSNISKMFTRLNKQCRLLLLPTVMDYLPDDYTQCIVKWFKGQKADADATIKQYNDEKGNVCLQVVTDLPSNKVELWYCRNAQDRAKCWTKASLKKNDQGYSAELEMYSSPCDIAAFVITKGPVNVSTNVFNATVDNVKNVKMPVRSLFSGTKKENIIAIGYRDSWHGEKHAVEYSKGYLDIVGAKGTGMLTFALNDPCIRRHDLFTVSFDVCCTVAQTLHIYVTCDFGGENTSYEQSVALIGDGKWQRVTVESSDFHSVDDAHQMPDDETAEVLAFTADEEFIINNVFLV